MRTFWTCVIISLCIHVLLFPGALKAMMKTGESKQAPKTPQRVHIRMVKKPKPQPPPPKVSAVPKVEPKPKVQSKPKVQPKSLPRPIVEKPVVKPPPPRVVPQPVKPPKPRPAKPQAQPKVAVKPAYPKKRPSLSPPTSVPKAKPTSSQKRLTSTNKAATRSPVTVRSESTSSGQGQTGVVDWSPPSESAVTTDSPDTGFGVEGGTDPPSPVPLAAPDTDSNAGAPQPKPVAARPKPPQPIEAPPKPKEQPRPKPKPAPQARAAVISVPTINPPAKFRRERIKSKLWVRFNIEANGTFEVTLFESSGNQEFDDFVLAEVRKTARVEPAIGDDGQAKRSSPRKPVDISVQ